MVPGNGHILSKTTEVQTSLSKLEQILQQVVWFGTPLPGFLGCFTGGQCKGRGDSGAPGHQVQRWVHRWQSCSSDQVRAATVSGTARNSPRRRSCPWFFGPYGGRCLSNKRGETLKGKLEPDGNVIRCFSPLGHQLKSSLFSSDQKSFPHGPREMPGEHRGCCFQTDKIVWR